MHTIKQSLLNGENIVLAGAHDALTARLAEEAGFDGIWGSGFEISASFGVPDANIITMTEQLERCRQMADSVSLPVIADCDNGYGSLANAVRTIQQFERANVAGVCLEDNVFPKRCSFYRGTVRALASLKEHANKIKDCISARQNNQFLVIARTEALIAEEGLDAALLRAHAYADAGADAVLVHSRADQPHEVLAFASLWQRPETPLVAVPTTYDQVPARVLHEAGFKIVIFANQGLRSAIRAIQENLRMLRQAGHASVLRERLVSIEEVARLVRVGDLREQGSAEALRPNVLKDEKAARSVFAQCIPI